jgi:hypothetical protein
MSKLIVKDLSKLKITKVKSWAIYFDYDNEKYLLHGSSEDYEHSIRLYKRIWNGKKYELDCIFGKFTITEDVKYKYIKPINAKYFKKDTIVYSQIDKEYFVKKLTFDYYFGGIYEKEIKKIKKQIQNKQDKMNNLEKEIRKLKELEV